MKLFTVGYEGWQIDDFVHYLSKNKVGRIADVRKNPISRKKGFSKKKLAEKLAEKKIGYIHMPTLGVPSAWRKLAKSKFITREKMFSDYVERILPKCADEIDELLKLAKSDDLALLCYEADANDCHRYFVADAMVHRTKRKITVKNLAGRDKI